MALHDITLTYGGLSVTFRNWRSADLPRSRRTFVTESTYAVSGNLIKSGTSFELPYIWTIVCDLYQTDYDKIIAIWEGLDYYRRLGSTTNGLIFVTIDDHTEEIFEWGKTSATKTRSAVAGTTPREANGGVYYYPRFLVDWVAPPELGQAYSSVKLSPNNSVRADQILIRAVAMVLQDTGIKA
jgi:hypothetical protein